jgi:hypothetical protein
LVDERLEAVRLGGSQICENLAVDLDVFPLQSINQLGVLDLQAAGERA